MSQIQLTRKYLAREKSTLSNTHLHSQRSHILMSREVALVDII